MVYETKDLNCVHTETMDVSPAILIPFYDEDSSTLFLSGKGETTIYGYEIAEDSPHIFPLSPFKTNVPSQGRIDDAIFGIFTQNCLIPFDRGLKT